MNFSFDTQQIDTSAPVLARRATRLRWSDSDNDPIDAWLVKRYDGTYANPTLNFREQFYVSPYQTNNRAGINLENFQNNVAYNLGAAQFTNVDFPAGGVIGARPAGKTFGASYQNNETTFEVYSVTGGTVSSVLGTFTYRPITSSKVQQKDLTSVYLLEQYYPDDATKQGFLTNRPVSTDHTRYDMAVEDEAMVALFQFEELDYVYATGKNLNNCDWASMIYRAKLNDGTTLTAHTMSLGVTPPAGYSNSLLNVPIGPYNMRDFVWTDATFSTQTSAWDYIEIQPYDGGTALALPIRVFKDCRPIKHSPAQLMFINDLGAPEYLRFDGRVIDRFDTGSRDTYKFNDGDFAVANTYVFPFYPHAEVPQSKGTQTLVLSEDFFTDNERELFKQAMTSSQCLVSFKGTWLPGFISTSTYNHEESASRLLPIRCEVQILNDLLC